LFVKQIKDYELDGNGIAHISVRGVLREDAEPLHEILGGTDYAAIRAELERAVKDGAKGVLLTVNSPGGTVRGCPETAQAIADCPIPVLGYAEGQACSAGYYLLAGCAAIVASDSADVGNIGTITAFTDDSELLGKLGIKMLVWTNDGAEFKSIGYNGVNDAQAEFLQERVNGLGEQFKSFVSTNREVSPVVFKAGWYNGAQAKSLGLIDFVGSRYVAYSALQELIEISLTPVI
jgi:protease-4